MKYNNREINEMVSRILSEEIEDKSEFFADKIEDEMGSSEIDKSACDYHMKKFGPNNERTIKFCGTERGEELDETKELTKKQKENLDVAKPKGKLTKDDFEKLRSMNNKKQMDEFFFTDDEESETEDFGQYHGDEREDREAEMMSKNEPTYVGRGLEDNKRGKKFGSFANSDVWYMDDDRQFSGPFDFDYEEEEFDEFEPMYAKHGKNTRWFAPGEEGKKMFDTYKKHHGGPLIVRTRIEDDMVNNDEVLYEIEVEENEMEEGNPFAYAAKKAKEDGKKEFEIGGKKFPVEETKGKVCKKCGMKNCKCKHAKVEEGKEKWIQKTDMNKGALHKKLGIPSDEKIPNNLLSKLKKELMSKAEGDKKLSSSDSKLLKQVNMAKTLKNIKESTRNLNLTEDELVDLIENIVREEKKDEKNKIISKSKNNITGKEATGLRKTEKVLSKNKKEGDDYFKDLTKKLTDYLKKGSKAGYEMSPKSFPKQNGQIDKDMKKKAYKASNAVEEYVENFAYPGMENLHYDEIKPNEEWLTDNLEGSSRTGNNPEWANAEPTDLGKKVNNKRKKNLYQKEKHKSYNRYTQPIDQAGEHEGESSLDSMFAKLESTSEKSKQRIDEDLQKIKNLISYDRKTQ